MDPNAVIDGDIVVGGPYIPHQVNLTLAEIVRDAKTPLLLAGVYTRCEVHGHEEPTSYYSYPISPLAAGCLALLGYISQVPKSLEATTLFLESQLQKAEIANLMAKGLLDHNSEKGYTPSEKARDARYNFSI